MKCLKKENEVNHDTNDMSRFGGGCDLGIYDDCNINTDSYSNLGHSYELPNEYTSGSIEAMNYLAGSFYFTVSEIEVFKLI